MPPIITTPASNPRTATVAIIAVSIVLSFTIFVKLLAKYAI
jgi:hypothetical protein